MNQIKQTTLSGDVLEVFAHRIVVKTATGMILADLSPKGAEQIRLQPGDHVELMGEMRLSGLKVHRAAKGGEPAITIDHPKPAHDDEIVEVDPRAALKTAEANGFTVLGSPQRKPKHFEILGRDSGGDLVEMHIELDGTLRKTKPVDTSDSKWALAIEVNVRK